MSSLVVMSKGTKFTQQSYKVSDSFPFEWIKKKWREAFHVTAMATSGTQVRHRELGAGIWAAGSWDRPPAWRVARCKAAHPRRLCLRAEPDPQRWATAMPATSPSLATPCCSTPPLHAS